jgi:hypothetical protein
MPGLGQARVQLRTQRGFVFNQQDAHGAFSGVHSTRFALQDLARAGIDLELHQAAIGLQQFDLVLPLLLVVVKKQLQRRN